MLALFSKNQFIRSLLLLPLALILNISMVLLDRRIERVDRNHLDAWIAEVFQSNPNLHWFVYCFMLFIMAVLINRLTIINRLTNSMSLLPGMFFVILASIFPLSKEIDSSLIAGFFAILALSNLYYAGNRRGNEAKLFNVGLYWGIMSLIYPLSLLFVLFSFISINIMRAIRRQDVFNLLNATLLPIYFFLAIAYILKWDLAIYWSDWKAAWSMPSFDSEDTIVLIQIIIAVIYGMLCFALYGVGISKKTIQTIRKIIILMWFGFFSTFAALFCSIYGFPFIFLLAAPLSFFMSEMIQRIPKSGTAEFIVLVLIVFNLILPLMIL